MSRSVSGQNSYRHSGNYSAAGLLVAVLVAGALAAALSPIYALALYFIPLAFINCFVTFAYGLALGSGTGYGFRLGKVRSTGLAIIAALVIGVIADYFGWVAWFLVAKHRFLWQPSDLISVFRILAEKGSWSIGGSIPTGALLYVIWAAELLAIAVFSALAAHQSLDQQVFCESCHDWLPKPKTIGPLAPIQPGQTAHVSADLIKSLQPITNTPVATFVELRSCNKCQRFSVYTVTLTTTSIGKDGKRSTQRAVLVRNAHASADLSQALAIKAGRA